MLLYKNGMSLMYGMSTMVLLVLRFDSFPEIIGFLCFSDIILDYYFILEQVQYLNLQFVGCISFFSRNTFFYFQKSAIKMKAKSKYTSQSQWILPLANFFMSTFLSWHEISGQCFIFIQSDRVKQSSCDGNFCLMEIITITEKSALLLVKKKSIFRPAPGHGNIFVSDKQT